MGRNIKDTNEMKGNNIYIFDVQRINERPNKVVITDRMWARLLSSTNQPSFLRTKDTEEEKDEEPITPLLEDGGK